MSAPQTLFAIGSLRVTSDYVRTARETIRLDDVDMISVRRPLLFVLSPASFLLLALWAIFQADWYPNEAAVLIGTAAVFAVLAAGVGELRIHSLSLRDESVFGPIWRLKAARCFIEEATFAKASKPIPAAEVIATVNDNS